MAEKFTILRKLSELVLCYVSNVGYSVWTGPRSYSSIGVDANATPSAKQSDGLRRQRNALIPVSPVRLHSTAAAADRAGAPLSPSHQWAAKEPENVREEGPQRAAPLLSPVSSDEVAQEADGARANDAEIAVSGSVSAGPVEALPDSLRLSSAGPAARSREETMSYSATRMAASSRFEDENEVQTPRKFIPCLPSEDNVLDCRNIAENKTAPSQFPSYLDKYIHREEASVSSAYNYEASISEIIPKDTNWSTIDVSAESGAGVKESKRSEIISSKSKSLKKARKNKSLPSEREWTSATLRHPHVLSGSQYCGVRLLEWPWQIEADISFERVTDSSRPLRRWTMQSSELPTDVRSSRGAADESSLNELDESISSRESYSDFLKHYERPGKSQPPVHSSRNEKGRYIFRSDKSSADIGKGKGDEEPPTKGSRLWKLQEEFDKEHDSYISALQTNCVEEERKLQTINNIYHFF